MIHLAFKHEAMRTGDFMGAIDPDLAATQAIGETLVGTGKPFVTTGGTLMLAMAGITRPAGHRGRPVRRWSADRRGELHARARPTGRALLGRPAGADGPQRP